MKDFFQLEAHTYYLLIRKQGEIFSHVSDKEIYKWIL